MQNIFIFYLSSFLFTIHPAHSDANSVSQQSEKENECYRFDVQRTRENIEQSATSKDGQYKVTVKQEELNGVSETFVSVVHISGPETKKQYAIIEIHAKASAKFPTLLRKDTWKIHQLDVFYDSNGRITTTQLLSRVQFDHIVRKRKIYYISAQPVQLVDFLRHYGVLEQGNKKLSQTIEKILLPIVNVCVCTYNFPSSLYFCFPIKLLLIQLISRINSVLSF